MQASIWNGIGDYDYLLSLNEQEMRTFCAYYHVDWSFFTKTPAKHLEDEYFCFVSLERKAFALLPFLSLAFGGMYTNLPMCSTKKQISIDYGERVSCISGLYTDRRIVIRAAEFSVEDFRFPERS